MLDRLIPLMIIWVASLFFEAGTTPFFNSAIVILLIYCFYARKIHFDIGDMLLLLGTLSYTFISSGINDAIYYSIMYMVIYQLGKQIALVGDYTPERKSMWIITLIAVERMVSGTLNYINKPEGEVVWYDKNGTKFSSTRFEADLVMVAALLGFFIILMFRKRIILGIIGIVMSLACVYMGVDLDGRFALGCCLCGGVAVLILYMIENRLYRNRYMIVVIASLGVLCLCLPLAYNLDLFGYRNIYDKYFSGSGGFFTNTRFSLMAQQIRLFAEYPLGKCEVPLINYNGIEMHDAHNYWIDIGRRAGVIPAALYIAFSITTIVSLVKTWMYSRDVNKYGLIAAFIGIMLYTGLEVITFSWIWQTIVLMGGLLKGIVMSACDSEKDKVNSTYGIGISF